MLSVLLPGGIKKTVLAKCSLKHLKQKCSGITVEDGCIRCMLMYFFQSTFSRFITLRLGSMLSLLKVLLRT